MQGAKVAQAAEAAVESLDEAPPCIDVDSFGIISAAAANWTTAGTNELLRQVVELRDIADVNTAPFEAVDTLALLFSVQVRPCDNVLALSRHHNLWFATSPCCRAGARAKGLALPPDVAGVVRDAAVKGPMTGAISSVQECADFS